MKYIFVLLYCFSPVFVIGDVHGCLQEMECLLEFATKVRNNPFFVFVGDMINKGPRSLDVLG